MALYLALAFVLGMFVNELHNFLRSAHGILRIDQSNPKKDMYRFEIDNLDNIDKKKYAKLKIVSHK